MKKFLVIGACIASSIVAVISCTKSQEIDKVDNGSNSFKILNTSNVLTDQGLKNKIETTFSEIRIKSKLNNLLNSNSSMTNNQNASLITNIKVSSVNNVDVSSPISFDIPTPTINSYDGTDIQSVIFPQPSNNPNVSLSLVTFTKNGVLGDMAMLMSIETLSSISSQVSYYDLDNNLVVQFNVTNGNIDNVITYPSITPSNSTLGWWSRWGGCVAGGFNAFVDGKPVHAAFGLLCVAFGPSCAAGAAIGCAAAATF